MPHGPLPKVSPTATLDRETFNMKCPGETDIGNLEVFALKTAWDHIETRARVPAPTQ